MRNRLIKISAKGLKNGDKLTMDLDPCVFLWGDNAAGKTRVFDAVQLLATGYHPDFPRNNDGILRIAKGDELEVHGSFVDNDGRHWTCMRRWERREVERGQDKGKIKTSSEVLVIHPSGSKLIKKEAEAAIAALAGQPYAVDLSALMGETDTGRRKLIFELGATAAGWTLERVNEVLKVENLHSVKECDLSARSHDDLVTWLEREYQAAKERTKSARSEVAQCREAAARLDKDAGAVEPADVGALRRAHEAAQERSRQVSDQWARTEERQQADLTRALEAQETRRQAEARLQEARAELKRLREQAPVSGAPDTSTIRESIEDLEEGFDGIPSMREEIVTAEQALAKANDALNIAREKEQRAEVEAQMAETAYQNAVDRWHETERRARQQSEDAVVDATAEHRAAQARLVEAEQTFENIRQLFNAAEDSFDEPECPTCGEPLIPGKAITRFAARIDSAKNIVVEKLNVLDSVKQTAKEAVTQAVDSVDAEVRKWKEEGENARKNLTICKASVQEATRQHRTNEQALSIAREALRLAERRLEDLRSQLRAAEASSGDAEYGNRLATLEERMSGLEEAARKPVPDAQSLQTALEDTNRLAERARSAAKEAVADAYATLKDAEDKLTLYREAASVRQALIDAETVYAETQRVEEALGPKGLMGRIVHDVLGPFEAAVNRCLEGLDLGTFKARMEDARGNPVFHLGLQRGETYSPVEALCHGEQASVHAAILVGMATVGQAPWRVVQADHLERLDKKRREAFLHQIVSLAQAGLVDQVIAAGCTDTCPNVEGLTVVEVLPTAE